MNFIPLIPLWLLIAGFAISVIAAVFGAILVFNRPRSRAASLISFGLRLTALTTLAFFALQPHSKRDIIRVGDRPVAILLDVSDSMSLDDGSGDGFSRLERGIGLLTEVREIVKGAGGDTVSFAFADDVIPLTETIKPDSIPSKINGDTTNLACAINGIGNPAAAVVISDGVFSTTSGAEFPIFFVNPTGGPAPGGCWVNSAAAPSRVLPGSRFPVDIMYRTTTEEAVRFDIYDREEKVSSGNVASYRGFNKATLYVTEEEPGRRFYRVVGLPGKSDTYATTEIVRGPITVSFFAHNVDNDAAYLRRAMASNEAVELSYYPKIGKETADGNIGLTGSDVIVLANPSSEYLDTRFVSEIEERIENGAGLLLLFSASKPDTRTIDHTAIKALIPLTGSNPITPLGGGVPKIVTAPRTGNFGSGVVPSFTHLWDFGYPKPATETYWALSGTPVLTGMRYGRGRVMLLSGGGFYRWENARADDTLGLAHMAADLLLYLSKSADEGVNLSDNLVEIEGSIIISTTAKEEPAFIITGPDKIPAQLSPFEIEPGLWKAEFSPKTAGGYTLTVRRFSGDGLSVDKESILAVEPGGEARAGFPDIETMRSLGSGYFIRSEMRALKKELTAALLDTGPEKGETQNVQLLPNWVALGLFIVLLLAEWTIRRLMGLA